MSLNAAHKGYEYQDIYSAFVVLKAFREFNDFECFIDYKEHGEDSFDDLTIVTTHHKTKFQIRHSSERALRKDDFTGTQRLSLKIFSKSFAQQKVNTTYVLATTRDIDPNDKTLSPTNSRNNLVSKKVWCIDPKIFPTLNPLFMNNFIIDASLPSISADFRHPGELESLLFDFLKQEIGLGVYPNDSLSAENFADILCRLIRSLRSGTIDQPVSKTTLINLFQSSGLKVDYGQIAQQFPIVPENRRLHFKNLQEELMKECLNSPSVILVGLPGSGKSHQFDDLFNNLNKERDVIAIQHYCYIEPTDDLVIERINVNRMFGNLVYQLTNKFPDISEKLPRLYAADRIKTEEFTKAISEKEKKRVIVMIDGLDHLERVVDQKGGLSPAIVNKFIEELLLLQLPANSSLLISSQPGPHLQKFKERQGVKIIEIPAWKESYIEQYLLKESVTSSVLEQQKNGSTYLSRLTEISEGNPLYLNYLAKEVKKRLFTSRDVWTVVTDLPQLNSDINKYYEHLMHTIRRNDLAIAETISLLDFSITKNQLVKMFPAVDRIRVLNVLIQLKPVLRDTFSLGGFRIYHESFRRYVLENASKKRKVSKKELYSDIIRWLVHQGFFESVISYNYLFSYLRRGQQQDQISDYITKDFLTDSIFNLHSTESISKNIAIAADVAAENYDWSTLARLTQLNKALYTFSEERNYLFDEISETYLRIFGAMAFSQKMVFDGKKVFSLANGFKYCHKIAKAGGNAPWAIYDLSDFKLEVDTEDKKKLFHELEAAVFYREIFGKDIAKAMEYLFSRLMRNRGISNQRRVDLIVEQIFFQYKTDKVLDVLFKEDNLSRCDSRTLLAFSTYVTTIQQKKHLSVYLAIKRRSLGTSDLARLTKIQLDIKPLIDSRKLIEKFKELSKSVIKLESLYGKDLKSFEVWYSLLIVVSTLKPIILNDILAQINADGWYRGWLIYLIELSLVENFSSQEEREKGVINALEKLSYYQSPFRGSPRACDLYSIHHLTKDSFKRALEIIQTTISIKKTIPLLMKISSGTTTTLQRSPGGPLTEDILSEIYIQYLDSKQPKVREILKKGVLEQFNTVQTRGRFYEMQADEGFKTARVLATMGERSKALKVFRQACTYAFGYGFRKDITLWEIIEPIPSLYSHDKKFAFEALSKTYWLSYIVTLHTDGAETKWSLSYWYKNLFNSDLKIGIKFLTESIKNNHEERDWRIEDISEDLANRLVGKINPVLLASLYKSLYMDDFDGTDFQARLDLLEDFYKKGISAEDYIDDLSWWLMSWRYGFTDKKPYLEILRKFFALSTKYKFNLAPWLKKGLKQKIDAAAPKESPVYKKSPGKSKKKSSIFTPSMKLDQIRLAIEGSFSDNLFLEENIKVFSDLISQIAISGNEEEAYTLLIHYARRSFISGPLRALEEIGDKLLEKGLNNLAARAYAIGFFYSRGGRGWLIMGDRESYPMAKKSVDISKKIFHSVLARQTAQAIESPVYFTGGNQHLMEVFCNVTNEISIAKSIWDESYNIINYRLPSRGIQGLNMPSVLSAKKPKDNIEKVIAELVKQRGKIKDG